MNLEIVLLFILSLLIFKTYNKKNSITTISVFFNNQKFNPV